MLAFMNGEFDVLATTIIESGLDVPNANTIFIIIILVCLTCIRCEVVGRSNKKAFCYFICPPYSAMNDDMRIQHWNNLVI
jgi:transcription-repair coupling factor (superfamily II helicase)